MTRDIPLPGTVGPWIVCQTALLSQLPVTLLVLPFLGGGGGGLLDVALARSPFYIVTALLALVGLLTLGLPFHRRAVRTGRASLRHYLLGGAVCGWAYMAVVSALMLLQSGARLTELFDLATDWPPMLLFLALYSAAVGIVPGAVTAGTGWYLLRRRASASAG